MAAIPNSASARRLSAFAFAGLSGFVVDLGLTVAFVRAGLDPTIARVPAVALAIAVTWYINRRLVFASTDARWFAELLRYYSVSAASAAINYAVFLGVLVALSAWGMARTATFPILVAALSGSGVAAFATYILAGRFAFHRSPGES